MRTSSRTSSEYSRPIGRAEFRIGIWQVDPATGALRCGDETVRLEARNMRLLVYMAEHAGEVISIDRLLDDVWSGVIVTQDSVYQAITALRRALKDNPKRSAYIATVPRQGYRLIAEVELCRVEKELSCSLHVAYLLDGSIRKSGDTLRVAARLTRAGDGLVMWSGTCDRSWSNELKIQDDIAVEVAKALATLIR